MPAKGQDASFARQHRVSVRLLPREILVMDTIISTLPKVTTGPLPASQKIYVTPDAAPDISVPLREITLSSPAEPKVRVYDTTGPYTDPTIAIDVRKGLARVRRGWVLARGGVEEYDGRPIAADRQRQREGVGAAAVPQHAAAAARPRRPQDHAIRMGQGRRDHQGDDLRRRAREPRPQAGARARQGAAGRRRELRRVAARVHHAGIRAQAKSRSAAPSSRPTSTTPNSSR